MAAVRITDRDGRLYMETRAFGKRRRKALGLTLTGDKAEDKKIWALAKTIRAKKEMQLACAEWGIPDLSGGNTVLHEYMEENAKNSGGTAVLGCLRYLKAYKYGEIRLSAITARWVEGFQRHLREETGLSQGSASLYAGALRKQLRLAARDGLILSNPAEFVRNIPMPESRKRPLSLLELKRLSRIPIGGRLGAEVKRAFLFSCFTGLRVSDLRGLRRGMFRERSDGTVWLCKEQKKTGRRVDVPLHKCARCLAGPLDGSDQPVFPLLSKTGTNTDQYLKVWGLKAGIDGVSWHTARHTMATLALEGGAGIRTVSELLGHQGVSTTLRYAKATDPLKKAAIEGLSPL